MVRTIVPARGPKQCEEGGQRDPPLSVMIMVSFMRMMRMMMMMMVMIMMMLRRRADPKTAKHTLREPAQSKCT